MFSKTIIATASILAIGASSALAGHTIQVNNNCGESFRMIPQTGQADVNSAGGGTYTYSEDIRAVAFVGSGSGSTTAEFSLLSSGESLADIYIGSGFNHPLTITLDDGQSKTCQNPGCPDAYNDPSQVTNDDRTIKETNPNSSITLQFC